MRLVGLLLIGIVLQGCLSRHTSINIADTELSQIENQSLFFSNLDLNLMHQWREDLIEIYELDRHYCSKNISKCKDGEKFTDRGDWKLIEPTILLDDQIWYCKAPRESWEILNGWHGYGVFREDKLMAYITIAWK